MNTTAILLAVALAANPTTVTQKTERGFLSGLGISLLLAGTTGIGLGVAGVFGANDAQSLLSKFDGAAEREPESLAFLAGRRDANTALAGVGFLAGGLALIGGVICLVADSPRVNVAVVPGPNGGVMVFSGRF